MKEFVYIDDCRRQYILDYFGEEFKCDDCENCDNCLDKSISISKDFTSQTQILFQTIHDTLSIYGATMIIDIIRGSKSKKIPKKYTEIKTYGIGKEYPVKWWKIFIRMLITNKLLVEKLVERGHTIHRTVKAKKMLESEKKIILNVPKEMMEYYNIAINTESLSDNMDDNFDLLSQLRMELAKQENIKPEYIFEDATLYKIADIMPTSIQELSMIDGVEYTKCTKYGEEFIDLISSLTDFEDKPKKLSTIDQTFNMFQNKKMSIKDISKVRNIKQVTVENHITELYKNGKQLDLNRLNFYDDIYTQISDKIIELDNPNKLNIIKKNLPNNITYVQIKLAKVRMEREV